MGHHVFFVNDRIKIARWLHGIAPIEFFIEGKSVSYNTAILLVLMFASPISFGRKYFSKIFSALMVLFIFHLALLIFTSINPFPITGPRVPAAAIPYWEMYSPYKRTVIGMIVKLFHGAGTELAPIVIWLAAARKNAV